jgi:TonB family protein
MTLAVILTLLLAQTTPSPSPLPTGTCSHEATIVMPIMPEFPRSLAPAGPFTVEATVLVGPDGSVRSATISHSSGYSSVDAAVINAARASTYSPKVLECKPVEGRYLFRADVKPGPP